MEAVEAFKTKYSGLSEADYIAIIVKLSSENFKLRHMLFSSHSERTKADPIDINPIFNEIQEIADQADQTENATLTENTNESISTASGNNGKKSKPKNRSKRKPR